jgi:ribose transport system ATP-binding protein
VARLMVGRDMSHLYPDRPPKVEGEPVLDVHDMNVPGFANGTSFNVRAREST